MKTQEEIEVMANDFVSLAFSKQDLYDGFINGYFQCQQDMVDKKYTEEDLHTILRLRREWYSHTDKNVVRDFINSLNEQ